MSANTRFQRSEGVEEGKRERERERERDEKERDREGERKYRETGVEISRAETNPDFIESESLPGS